MSGVKKDLPGFVRKVGREEAQLSDVFAGARNRDVAKGALEVSAIGQGPSHDRHILQTPPRIGHDAHQRRI